MIRGGAIVDHSLLTGFHQRAGLGLLFLVYAAVVWRAVQHEYVWDDRANIVHSEFLGRDLRGGLLATQQRQLSAESMSNAHLRLVHDSYRPLLFVSYALDVALFGKSAWAMHAHNLLLGVLLIGLVFLLSRRVMHDANQALTVAAIFALHPLQIEPWAYISARSDLLSGLWALAAVWTVLPRERGAELTRIRWRVLACFTCTLLSLLAKESSVGLPCALLGICLTQRRARAWVGPLASALAVLSYLGLRRALLSGAAAAPSARFVIDALWGYPAMAAHYLRLFVLPFDLSIERPYRDPSGLGWVVLAVCLLGAVLARKQIVALCERSRDTAIALAGVNWAFVLLGPAAVVVVIQHVLADRYMFLPIWGLSLAAVAAYRMLVTRLPRLRLLLLSTASLWAALLLAVSYLQIDTWRDNSTLYAHAVRMEPTSAMAQFRFGCALAERGLWRRAKAAFERAAELDGAKPEILNNLAVAYMALGELPRAERTLRKSLASSQQEHYRAWLNLGTVLLGLHRGAEACVAIAQAIQLNPAYARARSAWTESCAHAAPTHQPP